MARTGIIAQNRCSRATWAPSHACTACFCQIWDASKLLCLYLHAYLCLLLLTHTTWLARAACPPLLPGPRSTRTPTSLARAEHVRAFCLSLTTCACSGTMCTSPWLARAARAPHLAGRTGMRTWPCYGAHAPTPNRAESPATRACFRQGSLWNGDPCNRGPHFQHPLPAAHADTHTLVKM